MRAAEEEYEPEWREPPNIHNFRTSTPPNNNSNWQTQFDSTSDTPQRGNAFSILPKSSMTDDPFLLVTEQFHRPTNVCIP
jgi:hypothetical protein